MRGLEQLAERLNTLLSTQSKPKAISIQGVAKLAHRNLKHSFTSSIRSTNNCSTSSSSLLQTPTPSNRHLKVVSTGPKKLNSSLSDPPNEIHNLNNIDDQIDGRLDNRYVPFSSTLRGSRKLRIIDVLELECGQKVTLVIPNEPKKKDGLLATSHRDNIRNLMKRAIRNSIQRNASSIEKDDMCDYDFSLREVERSGKQYHEFNVTIAHYAERTKLHMENYSESDLNNLLQPELRAGISVSLDGYSDLDRGIMIQFLALPYVEIWVERATSESMLDSRVEFPRNAKDDTISSYMQREMNAANGDPIATLDILMKCYHCQFTNSKKDVAKLTESIEKQTLKAVTEYSSNESSESRTDNGKSDDEVYSVVLTALKNETNKHKITSFASKIDSIYAKRMAETIRFIRILLWKTCDKLAMVDSA